MRHARTRPIPARTRAALLLAWALWLQVLAVVPHHHDGDEPAVQHGCAVCAQLQQASHLLGPAPAATAAGTAAAPAALAAAAAPALAPHWRPGPRAPPR